MFRKNVYLFHEKKVFRLLLLESNVRTYFFKLHDNGCIWSLASHWYYICSLCSSFWYTIWETLYCWNNIFNIMYGDILLVVLFFTLNEWVNDYCWTPMSNISFISWRKQATFWWDDDIHYLLDSASSLKQ